MGARAAATLLLAALAASPAAGAEDLKLGLPIDCTLGQTCWVQQYADHDPSPAVQDYACGAQTYEGHDGTDIRIRDTAASADVVAAAPGTVKAVRDGMDDRLVRSDADRKAIANVECGNGAVVTHEGGWETQYCHMREGSLAVKAGDRVALGQKLGTVGYSGMAAFPHVHLTVRKDGKTVDPFRSTGSGAQCGGPDDPLWSADALQDLDYVRGAILRAGFAPGAIELPALEEGAVPDKSPADSWPAMVAYVWAINLEAGDTVRISLRGPKGFAASNEATLDRAKAQYMLFSGKKRPAGGWVAGTYTGEVEILNGGAVRMSQRWETRLD